MKDIDFKAKVVNFFPKYKEEEVLKIAYPSGMLKIDRTSKGYLKVVGPTKIIQYIDESCERGHKSFFKDDQYLFPGASRFALEEVGSTTSTGLVKLTIFYKVLVGYGSKIFDEDSEYPFYNNYIKEMIEDTPIYCFRK